MIISFDVRTDLGDCYRVILSSGEDAFFVSQLDSRLFNEEIEIVEIDLERISGNNPTSIDTLKRIAEGIGNCFLQNDRAVLYYYCDDLLEVPNRIRKVDLWPQEYRSQLFSLMFKRFVQKNGIEDLADITIEIDEDGRPLLMHLIAREQHLKYIEIIKDYVSVHYGK